MKAAAREGTRGGGGAETHRWESKTRKATPPTTVDTVSVVPPSVTSFSFSIKSVSCFRSKTRRTMYCGGIFGSCVEKIVFI